MKPRIEVRRPKRSLVSYAITCARPAPPVLDRKNRREPREQKSESLFPRVFSVIKGVNWFAECLMSPDWRSNESALMTKTGYDFELNLDMVF